VQVSFDEFVRDLAAEVCVILEQRMEKKRRQLRKAAEAICEAGAMRAATWRLAVPADSAGLAGLDPEQFAAVVSGELPPDGPGSPDVPRWHPEHPHNSPRGDL
jgi:hypothetical protein